MSEFRHEFTVKRSEWYRGQGSTRSNLLREDGQKCCVGFFCLSLGADPDEILGCAEVQSSAQAPGMLRSLYHSGSMTTWAGNLYTRNDSQIISDEQREAALVTLFAKKGIRVNFID